MRVREKHTDEEFELVLIEDLPDYASFEENTDERAMPGERWVPLLSPSGETVLTSLAPGAAVIIDADGQRTGVTNAHSDQYEWLEG